MSMMVFCLLLASGLTDVLLTHFVCRP